MERARLYKAPNETCFGVQVATNNIAEGLKAAQLAAEAGAAWLDLNCGCPIYGAWGCCLWAGSRRSWVQCPLHAQPLGGLPFSVHGQLHVLLDLTRVPSCSMWAISRSAVKQQDIALVGALWQWHSRRFSLHTI